MWSIGSEVVGEEEPSSFDFPFIKAHVLPRSSIGSLWHAGRFTLSFIMDWRKTKKLEILFYLVACFSLSLHYLNGSHFTWRNQNSLASPYYLFLTDKYSLVIDWTSTWDTLNQNYRFKELDLVANICLPGRSHILQEVALFRMSWRSASPCSFIWQILST